MFSEVGNLALQNKILCIMYNNTSLVYVVGLYDFVTTSSIVASREGRLIELYAFVAVVYFILCSLAGGLVDRYAERYYR